MLKELFSTDIGLMSLGVIAFVIVMGGYFLLKLTKLAASAPGKEGWD